VVFECIEGISNRTRLPAALGSRSPDRFRAAGNG